MIQSEYKIFPTYDYIAGFDESGRGPLAGPVVAAGVILPKNYKIKGLDDSKKLSPSKREELFSQIKEIAVDYSIAVVDNRKIDEINILQTSLLAMSKTAKKLYPIPQLCLIDGIYTLSRYIGKLGIRNYNCKAIVKGDSKFHCIAAASIMAKVIRDEIMIAYHKQYPQYNFYKNKGYPTKEHILALRKYGPTPIHRRSYKPVSQLFLIEI